MAARCTLQHMTYNQENLVLEINIPIKHLEDYTNISLLCRERNKEETERRLPLKKINELEETWTFEGVISKSDFPEFIEEGLFWDLYVHFASEDKSEQKDEDSITDSDEEMDSEDENDADESDFDSGADEDSEWDNDNDEVGKKEIKRRLRSNYTELDLLFNLQDETGKMLIPYTTNKGNVSFKIKDLGLLAKAERAVLKKDGSFSISGYALDPSGKMEIQNRFLVLKINKDDEDRLKLPLTVMERQDLNEKFVSGNKDFSQIGFMAETNLIQDFDSELEKLKYKAYIQFEVLANGEKQIIQSPALKLEMFDQVFSPQAFIVRMDKNKKRLRLTRTKKNHHLIVSMKEYQWLNEVKGKVKKKIRSVKRSKRTKMLYKKAFKFVGLLPANKKLVMFESYLGKQYSCNPRAIYEYLKENHPEYKMYWSVDPKYIHNFKDKDAEVIRRFSVKWLFAMARAQYWVTNSRMPLWIPKPAHTKYLQTWHGTPLKRLAADMEEVHMPGTTTAKYKRNFLREARNWDYLISPNRYSSEIFQRAFQFDKDMLETGYPRNDFLYQSNNTETITAFKEKFGIPLDRKIVLYAPTWRDNQFYGKGRYKFDLDLDLKMMQEKLGDEYIVIMRMHYLVAENFDLTPYNGFAYDFSNHEDIRELYLISDILITDYSSVFFDYANLRRPIIFFVYDIDDYRDNLRGFYFDFEEVAPGPLVKTTDQVIESIKQTEKDSFSLPSSFEAFYERFCYLESGQSSKRVVERVFRGRTGK